MNDRTRTWLSVAAAAALAGGLWMATSVDRGLTHAWAHGARASWAIALLVLAMGGVLGLLVGLGVISSDDLAEVGEGKSPSVGQFMAVYALSLLVGVLLGFYLERQFRVPAARTILVYCGCLFLLGASGRPWWLFGTIRRSGWFALIERDTTMRVILGVVGAGAVAAGMAAS